MWYIILELYVLYSSPFNSPTEDNNPFTKDFYTHNIESLKNVYYPFFEQKYLCMSMITCTQMQNALISFMYVHKSHIPAHAYQIHLNCRH